MEPIFFGIIWGMLFAFNLQNSDTFKCKMESDQKACAKIELKK